MGESSRDKKTKYPVNLWLYKTELLILTESEKLAFNDVPYLECQGAFKVKPVEQQAMTDYMYNVFGRLVNQESNFMHQWVRVYTLTHKKQVYGISTKYLQSRGIKLPEWLSEVKDGKLVDILSIYILCKATQTHCFIHYNGGIWSTLQEDPKCHQEYVQRCNLHLVYIGSNAYAELTAYTEIVQYEIFGIAKPLLVEMNVSEQSASSLSSSELESLKMLVDIDTPTHPPVTGQTQTGSTSLVHEQMTGTTKMTMTKSSANKVTRVAETQTTRKVDEPVPSTSRASDPSKACTVKITKRHEAVTTKLNRKEQSKTDTDFQSASMLHDPKLTPKLTSDEINNILKRQPRIFYYR